MTVALPTTIFTRLSEDGELRYRLIEMAGGRTVLSGAGSGRNVLSALIAAARSSEIPTPAFLDFDQIDVATSSFLRESVVGFRDYARQSLPNLYPVVANLSPAVAEELEFFIRSRNDAVWSCEIDKSDRIINARLVGELDTAQRSTFEAVIEIGAITAPELAARFSSQNIGPTAWNNRLSSLAAKGLLVERKKGKSKSFSSLLEIM